MIKFISFADSRMVLARIRIEAQARAMGVFDAVEVFDERTLFPDLEAWDFLFKPGVKGFGYWCWKPYLIERELKKLREGDMLLYVDAGSWLNDEGVHCLRRYFAELETDPLGVKAFEVPIVFRGDKRCLVREWTKGHVIDRLGCRDRQDLLNSVQVEASVVFCRRCDSAMRLLSDWNRSWQEDLAMFDDTLSPQGELPEFRQPRHDQSVFSLLFRKAGGRCYPFGELWTDGDWGTLREKPIWNMRDRGLYRRSMARLLVLKFASLLPFAGAYFRRQMERTFLRRPFLRPAFCLRGLWLIWLHREGNEQAARLLWKHCYRHHGASEIVT